ncbi:MULTISPECIES: MFS transporter [Micromonospora]|uniref:MFS transporter n=1 Tax=Micromonospora solifontis TaxID=2487138 RepID=A0ABX9W949_9ACTN|nr:MULTISPECIES: MFS transporter [Micromonospora]NES17222.1 MFS transporter [Micromonospora sp. PPF5-17B]NES39431.1 MFS transporter [Micromonospora solifontis]NES59016.1 MFS transporter [Micromonospora sp. PPF5-6]RNL88999.1 MFS transporter [Micromonospora solifontis]
MTSSVNAADAGTGTPDRRWLTRGVGGIGAASLLADVGHEVPTALLPSLLTSTLGAPAAALGVIEGVSDALAGSARFAGGALADDPDRRRRIAVGGYTTTAMLAGLTGAATSVGQVAVLRAGAWAARGLRVPARNALLADVVHPSAYGRAYGFERMMDNLGAVFGPMLALGLVAAVGVRWAIGLSVIPGLLAAGAIVYAIRHTARPAARARVPLRFRVRPLLRGELGRLMAAVTAFEVGNVAATLLILRATELLTPAHGVTAATSLALVLYILYDLAATGASLPAGRAADRLGARGAIWVLATGVALFLAAYLGFTIDTANLALLALPFAAAGIAIGCVETAEHAAVAALAPAQLRGSAFGLLATVQAGGNLAASSVAGILWTAASPTFAFGYLAAWMLIALIGLVTAGRRSTHDSP